MMFKAAKRQQLPSTITSPSTHSRNDGKRGGRFALGSCLLTLAFLFLVVLPSTFQLGALLDAAAPSKSEEVVVTTSTQDFVKKKRGENWELWDRDRVLNSELNITCIWATFRPAINSRSITDYMPETPMCVHEQDRWVSGAIVEDGRWQDCDDLSRLVNSQRDNGTPVVHLEIGANIGSCLMQVLTTTQATIIAFEPDPRNLFVMTSTLMGMDRNVRDRVFLFPVALGEHPAKSEINVAENNRGNAVVGKVIKDGPLQKFLEPAPIQIERIDDLLDGSKIPGGINLLKMDAQGFECFIIAGMTELLKHVNMIYYEFDAHFLDAFEGCSTRILWDRIAQADFEHFAPRFLPNETTTLEPIPVLPKKLKDVLARKRIPFVVV